jgi:hypothetical protein
MNEKNYDHEEASMNEPLVRMARAGMARDRLNAGGDEPMDRLTCLTADHQLFWEVAEGGFMFMAQAGQKLAVRSLNPNQIYPAVKGWIEAGCPAFATTTDDDKAWSIPIKRSLNDI